MLPPVARRQGRGYSRGYGRGCGQDGGRCNCGEKGSRRLREKNTLLASLGQRNEECVAGKHEWLSNPSLIHADEMGSI